jgi:hypothetical protein
VVITGFGNVCVGDEFIFELVRAGEFSNFGNLSFSDIILKKK